MFFGPLGIHEGYGFRERYALMKKLTKGDAIPGIFSVIIGVFGLVLILTNQKMTILGNSLTGVLGPGFFPFLASLCLVLLGIALISRGIRQNGGIDYLNLTPETKKNFLTIGLITGSCLLLLIIWKLTKNYFIISLFIYSIVLNLLLKRSKVFTIIFAVVLTGFIYALFVMAFGINFRP